MFSPDRVLVKIIMQWFEARVPMSEDEEIKFIHDLMNIFTVVIVLPKEKV